MKFESIPQGKKLPPHHNEIDNRFIIRNAGNFNKEINDENEHFISEGLNKSYQEVKEKSLDWKKHFGEDFPDKLEKLNIVIQEEMLSRGQENVNIKESFLLGTVGKHISGSSSPSHTKISLFYFKNIEKKEFKQLEVLRLFAHETYHGSGIVSFDAIEDSEYENEVSLKYKAHGASYYTKENKEYAQAFEEGLAVDFEVAMFEKIKDFFSKDIVDEFSNTNDSSLKKHELVDDFIDSYNLVQFLKEQIPDFYKIVEKARIERRTLDLVRAIEGKFGEGSYRKLTTATTEQSTDLLQEFKSIIETKPE